MPRYSSAVLEALPIAAAEWEAAQADALAARASVESDAEIKPSALLDWATRYRRIDGRPFSLDRFAPLRAIYADDSKRIVVMKPSQRGASEWAINYAVFALDRGADVWTDGAKEGVNVGYIFPTASSLSAFSKERVAGLKHESPSLAALFGDGDDYDTVDFKQVGRSYLYLRGGWSDTGLLSFAADVLILDEYDRMAPSAVALARRRLNASEIRREIMISTPTLPGVGIHALYLQSDRYVYETFHGCGAWVSFDFFRDVAVHGAPFALPGGGGWSTLSADAIRRSHVELVCPSCRRAVTDDERCGPGRWRSESPEIMSLRGYAIPWWPFPVVDLVEYAVSAVSADPSELTELFRSDLGLPYESSGSRVTREMVAALSYELVGGALPSQAYRAPTLGVDVGSRFHYRVSARGADGRTYILDAGSVGSWGEVDGLMTRHRIRLAVVDALPEEHGARAFAERFPGRAVTATYPTTATALRGVLFAPDAEKAVENGRVQINRTMAMDAVYGAIASARERWPSTLTSDAEVVEHLTAPVRVETADAHGQVRADWVHTKPDHLYHASVYDTIARALLASGRAVGLPLVQGAVRGW